MNALECCNKLDNNNDLIEAKLPNSRKKSLLMKFIFSNNYVHLK